MEVQATKTSSCNHQRDPITHRSMVVTSLEKGSGMKIVDMYDILYKAVREIDQDHIIFMGAFYSFDFLCNPREKGWENVVYQTHPYGADQRDNHEVQQQFTKPVSLLEIPNRTKAKMRSSGVSVFLSGVVI